jgi:hypothetical protein
MSFSVAYTSGGSAHYTDIFNGNVCSKPIFLPMQTVIGLESGIDNPKDVSLTGGDGKGLFSRLG